MISIIIPAYNAERTILQCVQAVLAQTFKDWELIIVDDGSKDRTLNLCQTFSDERIKVLHKENGGVSSARNMGLESARGEYITFIDADDRISSDYLLHLWQGRNYDLAITGFYYGSQPEKSNFKCCLSDKLSLGKELSTLINADQLCYPWGRLFKRIIIEQNHIRFDENMRFAEDNVFNWEYLCHTKSLYLHSIYKDYYKSSDGDKLGYNLSYLEMDYIDGRLFELSQRLENYYNIQLYLDPKQLMHVVFLNDILELPASQLWQYYKKYHPNGTMQDGYGFIMQTVYYLTLIDVSKVNRKKKRVQSLSRLSNFMDCPWRLFYYADMKTKYLIPFIKLRLFKVVLVLIDKIFK